jgi:tRNA G18 (ribose-2'-O)-methylase SpoU
VYACELKLMHEIAAFHIHRGVLAAGVRPEPAELSLHASLGHLRPEACRAQVRVVLAEGLTNVDNMGALFRNAAAFGANALVLDSACCDPLYRKAIRVSMGHALSVPYAVSDNWLPDLRRLRDEWGLTLIAAESTPDARPLWEMPHTDRIGILFGSEGHGLAAETLAMCDAVCGIPMAGEVPSINVAVASAVFLYELQRSAGGNSGRLR